jgi:hypothetical protein
MRKFVEYLSYFVVSAVVLFGLARNVSASYPLSLPFTYNDQTYVNMIMQVDDNGTEIRTLFIPATSTVGARHSTASNSDFIDTTPWYNTISAVGGVLDSGFQNYFTWNPYYSSTHENCFHDIRTTIDIYWYYSWAAGNTDACGNTHNDGDLIIPKNINLDGSQYVGDQCRYPTYCTFPNFLTTGQIICDPLWGGECESLYQMDVFNGVPSYLSTTTNATTCGSYHQCTEYAERYLHYKFGTDYSDKKNIDWGCTCKANIIDGCTIDPKLEDQTQGFYGSDFHPDYSGNPPKPTIKKGGSAKSLAQQKTPKAGDIAIFPAYRHTAVVKSVSGSLVSFIEQNWLKSGQYTINRYVTIPVSPVSGLYFYRFTAAVIKGSDSSYSSIQDAYNSTTTNGQTVMLQSLVDKCQDIGYPDVSGHR